MPFVLNQVHLLAQTVLRFPGAISLGVECRQHTHIILRQRGIPLSLQLQRCMFAMICFDTRHT